jgi:5-methylcytosine-specific restriction protein A
VKPLRTCLDCGELCDGPRCPKHRRARERLRGSASARGYDARYRRLRKEAIELHLQRYGAVCPGYGVLPHTATRAELSVDHIVPLADGGLNDPSNFQVICITCNKRKGRAHDVAVERAAPLPAAPTPKRGYLIA